MLVETPTQRKLRLHGFAQVRIPQDSLRPTTGRSTDAPSDSAKSGDRRRKPGRSTISTTLLEDRGGNNKSIAKATGGSDITSGHWEGTGNAPRPRWAPHWGLRSQTFPRIYRYTLGDVFRTHATKRP